MNRMCIVGARGYSHTVEDAMLCAGTQSLASIIDDSWPQSRQVWATLVFGMLAQLACLDGQIEPTYFVHDRNARLPVDRRRDGKVATLSTSFFLVWRYRTDKSRNKVL